MITIWDSLLAILQKANCPRRLPRYAGGAQIPVVVTEFHDEDGVMAERAVIPLAPEPPTWS